MTKPIRLGQTVEAGGCSAKLSPKMLEEVLAKVPLKRSERIIVGAETHDDAGVFLMDDGSYLIQTTDFFPPMVDDPFLFGQVAAANALSDIYAMGGTPLTALSLVMFPNTKLPLDYLPAMLTGGAEKVNEAGAFILGGHTIDDEPLKYGLAVTGTVKPEKLVTNDNARPGDKLILTKPLGTAVLTGARKVDLIEESDVRPAIRSMTLLNKSAAEVMNRFGVKAATDITGFGLLGHAYRMANAARLTFHIDTEALPALPKALDLIAMGAIPGGAMRNLEFVKPHLRYEDSLTDNRKWLALDPQTSGGLLMAVKADEAKDILQALHDKGLEAANIIGEVSAKEEMAIRLA